MKASDLRASLLSEAVSGRLVPQFADEGTAADLLKEIEAEKKALAAAGKIKKEKPLPEITEEEIPFEIPESWEWVRLGDIGIWQAGGTPSRAHSEYYHNGTVSWVKSGDLNDGEITNTDEAITFEGVENSSAKINPVGSVILAMYGATIGKTGILAIEAATNQACCACKLCGSINNKYLQHYLISQKKELTELGWGSAQPNISREKIVGYLFPLPPLAEQRRIVAKLDELMPLVDAYEKEEQQLSALERAFPENLRKSILQEAVSGKLVPQIAEEGTAAELLREIEAEKKALVAAGKIKKEKPLPEITEEEIPFEIPESWEWVRLGDIVEINPRNKLDDTLEVSFIPMPLIDDGYSNSHRSEIRKWGDIKSGFTHFSEGDVGVAKITPCFQNKKSVIFTNLKNGYGAGTTELHILRSFSKHIETKYILWFVKNPDFIKRGMDAFTGTAGQERVGKDFVANTLFPLPPLAEQRRIVAKVDELMKLVDTL